MVNVVTMPRTYSTIHRIMPRITLRGRMQHTTATRDEAASKTPWDRGSFLRSLIVQLLEPVDDRDGIAARLTRIGILEEQVFLVMWCDVIDPGVVAVGQLEQLGRALQAQTAILDLDGDTEELALARIGR